MKTKIFLAFLAVIAAALLASFLFGALIMRDFDNYVLGVREDQRYWVLASVEGSYEGGRWDRAALSEAIHWAMMMGLDIKILDARENEIISSREALSTLSASMQRRMKGMFHLHDSGKAFARSTLYHNEQSIGALLWRPFEREELKKKESIFKRRAQNFIYISFAIAGGGAVLLAFFLSRFLSGPITRLKAAAERIARRDFSVRLSSHAPASMARDEVDSLSEAFNMMAASLQKEEALRKRLMSNVAHELRTPLTVMKAHVEALADGVIKDREKGLETIGSEIDRLIKLVKGIEDITAAEASFFAKRQQEKLNLEEFLTGIAGELEPLFREKGLSMAVTGEAGLTVVTDVEKLERITINVLSNSLKYTDRGGVRIEYGQAGEEFFVDIKDTGRGISREELPRIFDRFHRADDRETEGLGLGLAIVKELVEVMGGKVEVESTPGEGTRLRVVLPVKGQS